MTRSSLAWRSAVAALAVAACGSKHRGSADDGGVSHAAPVRDTTAADCAAIGNRFRAALASAVKQIGAKELAPSAQALATCAQWTDAQRRCLLDAPATAGAWATCKVESPFVFFDGAPAHDHLLGAKVAAEDAKRRLDKLVGTWVHDTPEGRDTWTIGAGGKLATHHEAKQPGAKPSTDPPHQLGLERDREFAIHTGTSAQFVPCFVDGDRLYISWTSGALAVPIASDQAFALDLADRDRWLVWTQPACSIVDPHVGAVDAACSWQGDTFVQRSASHELVWQRRGDALVHPAMELFARQGK